MTMFVRRMSIITTLMVLLLMICSSLSAQSGATPAQARVVDEQTQMLLIPDEPTGKAVDAAGNAPVTLKGVEVVDDPTFGKVFSLGDEAGNHITLRELSKLDFDNGFTIETWVRINAQEKQKNPGGLFAFKGGSFALSISNKNTLDITWLSFPTVDVATDKEKQFKYYPVATDGFSGWIDIPENRWVHLAITYDPGQAVIRTWVNGSLDRERYISKAFYDPSPTLPMRKVAHHPVVLFKDMRQMQVASVRISGVARRFGRTNPLEAYVHQLPYAGQTAVLFTRFEKNLPYPLDASIIWESPNGGARVIERITLEDDSDRLVRMTPPGWNNAYYTITVRVNHGAQEIYQRTTHVTNGKTARDSRFHIDQDNVLSIGGKKIFPLMMYHVFAEDFKEVADMGFNILSVRAPMPSAFMGIGISGQRNMESLQQVLDAASQANTLLTISNRIGGSELTTRFARHPALAGWYSYDEPWGFTLSKVVTSYNLLKLTHPDIPVMAAQNNYTRLHETAEGVDVLIPDPYPIPNVSLRLVADATREAVVATAGLKPVWTAICQYGSKQPDTRELRCMAYLALTNGANGIAIYAWDDRMPDKTTKQLKGWYTKESPQDLATLREVMKELSQLSSVFLVPNTPQGVKKLDTNPAIHASIKIVDGKKYLLLANDSRQAEQAQLQIADVTTARARRISTAGKDLEIRDGKLSHTLEPLEAATYVLE